MLSRARRLACLWCVMIHRRRRTWVRQRRGHLAHEGATPTRQTQQQTACQRRRRYLWWMSAFWRRKTPSRFHIRSMRGLCRGRSLCAMRSRHGSSGTTTCTWTTRVWFLCVNKRFCRWRSLTEAGRSYVPFLITGRMSCVCLLRTTRVSRWTMRMCRPCCCRTCARPSRLIR